MEDQSTVLTPTSGFFSFTHEGIVTQKAKLKITTPRQLWRAGPVEEIKIAWDEI